MRIGPLAPVASAAAEEARCNDDATALHEPCPAPKSSLYEPPAPAAPVEAATDAARARAAERLAAVDRSDALVAGGLSRAEADAQVARETGATVPSVARWRRRAKGAADRLAALVDRAGRGRRATMWSAPEAEQLWAMWCTDYLREERPDGAAVWRRVGAIAAERGWRMPSLRAFLRRTEREVSAAERVRARDGALAAMDLVPHRERTVEGLQPMDIINGDGRRHDVLVEFADGKQQRPVVWMWQDVRTRRILAWAAGESESADLIRTSLHEVITRHGVPRRIVVDQTRAASATWATGGQPGRKRWRSSGEELPGLYRLLDIQYSPTAVDRDAAGRGQGRGRAKPIERAFGDLARQIDTHPELAGAATGRSTEDRPESHRMRAAPFEAFVAVTERCVAEHNARTGRRTEAAAGRSFDAVWEEEYPRAVVRQVSAAQAGLLLLAAEDALVQRNGTFQLRAGRGTGLPANRYGADALVERAGERVIARFDPARLHDALQVYDLEGRWVCEAACLLPVGFADASTVRGYEGARREMRRGAERSLRGRRDMEAYRRNLAATSSPPEPAPDIAPAAVELVTGRGLPGAPGAAVAEAATGRRRLAQALRAFHLDEEEAG